MSFWKWSRTAESNSTADSTINWAEGQAPSTVNNSARALMAAAAKYRDDISGALLTTGSSTAYVVASYQAYDSLANMNGAMIAFQPHTTNAQTVTLNVDGLGAKPLRFERLSSPRVELPAGSLVQGTPYVATYFNDTAEWVLQGLAGNPYNIPLGGMLEYTGTSAPNAAFILPFGQAISRTTYAAYFALVGTTYGVGDGSTMFNVIDKRGRVSAGKDDMGGSAASRIGSVVTDSGTIVGATLGSVGGSATHALTTAELAVHSHANSLNDPTHFHTIGSSPNEATGGVFNQGATAQQNSTVNTDAKATGMTITNANAGSGSAHAILPPTVIVNYILRVL